MHKLKDKLEQLAKKERELEMIRTKVVKGEIGGYGVPFLIEQVVSEINKLRKQIENITHKNKAGK